MSDRFDSSAETGFKCPRCGNDFPKAQETCDVCGFHCTDDACQTVAVTKEGF